MDYLDKPEKSTGCNIMEQLPNLSERPADSHKGDFGRIIVVAGSRGMSGAAVLTGMAALHTGAGLVTVATPKSVAPIVAAGHPALMTVWLDEDEAGRISRDGHNQLKSFIDDSEKRNCVFAIGPGLGRSPAIRELVFDLLQSFDLPAVVDADALNALSSDIGKFERQNGAATVLTPHVGEFVRLSGRSAEEIHSDREKVAVELTNSLPANTTVLLKGAKTIVTDGEQLAMNRTGNSGMATAGSGDVLTGVIASLIGQGMSAFAAAQLGAHLHGLSGDLAAKEFGERYVTAVEIVKSLGAAIKAARTSTGSS